MPERAKWLEPPPKWFFNWFCLLRSAEILCCELPVEQVVDHGCDIVGPTVLVVEVVGVFPYIDGQDWFLAAG